MNRTDAPTKQSKPFGINGQREAILPTTPAGDNTASYESGFPPITMILKSAGGLPPKGQDMNQILYELSALCRWFSAGALNTFDSSFSTGINGYPKYSLIISDDGSKLFLNTKDSNTSNPNSGGLDWVDITSYLGIDDKQDKDVNLTALSSLSGIPDGLPFFTGLGSMDMTSITKNGRELLSKNTIPETLQYLTLGDGTGRLLGVQAFSISGTYVKSAGVKKIIVEAVGGGGASGNLSATASNNAGISSVGSPGCYAKAYYYENIPSTVAVTIGSGGAAGTGPGGSGGDGGQTSFGTLLVCPGGKGSQQIQQVPPFSGGSTGEAGQPTGTGILFHSVSRSPSCAVMGLTQDQSIGLENTISTLLGVYGKGGTGAYNPANSPARNGNDGTQGYMLIWEYQ
ncbi:glycine-rich domain-containing protein [Citrobacter werkmanii]